MLNKGQRIFAGNDESEIITKIKKNEIRAQLEKTITEKNRRNIMLGFFKNFFFLNSMKLGCLCNDIDKRIKLEEIKEILESKWK